MTTDDDVFNDDISNEGCEPGFARVFSGRAEIAQDIFGLLRSIALAEAGKKGTGLVSVKMELLFLEPGFNSGEAAVEFFFKDPVAVEWLEDLIRKLKDTPHGLEAGIEPHVLLQTLRPVPRSENSLERDWSKQ